MTTQEKLIKSKLNRPCFPESVLVESGLSETRPLPAIIPMFEFRRWDIANWSPSCAKTRRF